MSSGVDQSFKIVEALSRKASMGFNELRRELGDMPASTLSRLLKNLLELGWAEKTPDGSYRCGDAGIGAAERIAGLFSIGMRLEPHVKALALRSGESAAFGVWDGDCLVFKAKHEMPDAFRYIDIGARNRDRNNLFLLVCLAFQPEGALDALFGEISAEERAALKKRLPSLKESSISICEDTKATRVLAPLVCGGKFRGAIGISVCRHALSETEISSYSLFVREAAESARASLSK